MKKTIYTDTSKIYKRASQLREFGDKGDASWKQWYDYNIERTRLSAGEIEQAIAEELGIDGPAAKGFAVAGIDDNSIILADLEEQNIADLSDESEKHHIEPVERFREWLSAYQENAADRVMGTDEAAALWGLSQSYIKILCQQKKLRSRIIGKQWIIDRDQPNPSQKTSEKM